MSARCFVRLAAIAIVSCVWPGGFAGVATAQQGEAREGGACRQTSRDVRSSCRKGAESDFLLALGRCDNVSNPSARRECRHQASTDRQAALNKCREQFDARQAACERLGEAPYDPVIDPANFVDTIDNPYFPLTPGTTYIYEAHTAQGLERSEFFVSHNTKEILGITCVEVRDAVTLEGELIEDTLDWFAQDTEGNVWYFGENSKQLEGGLIVGVEGSWTGGVDRSKPGIIMKAHPAVGDFYRQEFSPDTAEDLADVVSLTESVTVPYGSFDHCPEIEETQPLAPGAVAHKFYAAGVGNVLTIDLDTGDRDELVQILTE